jgi:aminoglycoside phosphotransferase (APT) family kinase protein
VTALPGWALARVPGLEHGVPPRLVTRLAGGSVNRVYRVDSAAGRFVLRLNGAAWRRPGVDRERELLLHQCAASAGIAPAVVHAAPQSEGLLVLEYCDGQVWEPGDFGDAASLARLGERLQVLHQLAAPALPVFDPMIVAHAYVQSIEARRPERAYRPEPAATLRTVLPRLEHGSAALRQMGEGASGIVHGDLAAGNLLQGERLWLLDWEYAQRGHPLLDLACVLAYYPQAAACRREFAAAAGLTAVADGELLAEAVYVYRALSWLWHLARGEDAPAP